MRRMAGSHLGSRIRVAIALTATSLLLGGCGGDVMQTLGLLPPTPNAFLVTTEAPLAIPTNLDTLPSPDPGAVRPQAVPARLRAEETLVPEVALSGPGGADSTGQRALIKAAGPTAPANPGAEFSKQKSPQQWDSGPLSWLLFWKPEPPPGVVIDPTKEARRLQTNAALGRPPTYGQTPILAPPSQGLF